MIPFLQKFLSLRKIEYLAVDRDFHILETSLGVKQLADCPHEVIQGKDVRLGFPELIGMENILLAILQEQQDSLELKGICRFSAHGTPLYIDVSIVNNQDEVTKKNRLIIFFENVTERMVMEQKLVQKSNETSLLLEAWSYSNKYLDRIINSMVEVLLVTNRSGVIKLVNKAIQELFSYSEEELIGQHISTIFSQGNALLPSNNSLSLVAEMLDNVEVVCQTKTGKKVSLSFSRSVIQVDKEGLQDLIYIGREIK